MSGAVPERAQLALMGRNPDVLTCIANLSSDEVFTPPELANQMLDTLSEAWSSTHGGASLWANPNARFLDPFTKSGVFLREITKRLVAGLAEELPDLGERVDHILTKQVYGIAITELTALIARRSLYCSKLANGKHSVAKSLETEQGRIWFDRTEHSWLNGRCRFCGANQAAYARPEGLETHAYAFIHVDSIGAWVTETFGEGMKFDVIIGNPPYQLNDGGGEGASAVPIYQLFVEQAKTLDPNHLIMVIPARWYSGGKGLDKFRETMLTDGHLAEVHDFPETDMVFPGVNIRGGVCFFRWSKDHSGPTQVVNYRKTGEPVMALRPALEPGLETFVRYNEATSILSKVRSHGEDTYGNRVQSRNPFGIPSNFLAYSADKSPERPVLLFRSRRGSTADKQVYIAANQIVSNQVWKDKIKVLVSKASPGGDEYPHAVLGQPFVAPRNSVCTETYLIVDFPDSLEEGENLVTYMQTRFFRFLVSLIKTTQNISRGSFAFVPVQDLSKPWTDEDLYAKYKISPEEVMFIESMVRPAGGSDE